MRRLFTCCFAIYWLLLAAPYFVPFLNRYTPTVFGIPFVIVYYCVVTFIYASIAFYMNHHVVETYMPKEESHE